MTWEDEVTAEAAPWPRDYREAAARAGAPDDRQQADLCGFCRKPTTDNDRINDPTRPGRVAHSVCVMRFAAAKGA